MDMVTYLSCLGYEPAKIRNNDYWYLSPLRVEKTPSFKVNRRINKWYDHGIGKGGNLIGFAILYHHCTVGDLLRRGIDNPSFHQSFIQSLAQNGKESSESKINILEEIALQSPVLCRYLHQRRIPLQIANRYCKEIKYRLNDKEYFGIGFKNDSGGFEIRNPYFKSSSAPKGISTIDIGGKEVCIFEGFMDLLSFISIIHNRMVTEANFVVLNSVSFFQKARPFMEGHDKIRLFLDRDKTGQNCSRYALSLNRNYVDESGLYQHNKDLNDWVMNMGKKGNRAVKTNHGSEDRIKRST